MKVLKFGGTSVGSCRALEHVRDIVMSQDTPVIVVVSALSGMTDRLVELSNIDGQSPRIPYLIGLFHDRFNTLVSDLIGTDVQSEVMAEIDLMLKELHDKLVGGVRGPHFQDVVVSYGERLSSTLIKHLFDSRNVVLIPSTDIIFTTDDRRSVNKEKSFKLIRNFLKEHSDADIYVMPGFIAQAPDGTVTNLGRGGSDLTAAVMARALDTSSIEIWTDVNGYMTADPKRDDKAVQIPSLSYEKALEMSCDGAKVVYAPAIEIMMDARIPLQVKNTFDPDGSFTSVY